MMKAWVCGAVLLVTGLALAGGAATAGEASVEQGGGLYKERCESCHGRRGEARALGRSKRLAELDEAAVLTRLKAAREAGTGRGMQDRIKSTVSEEEARALAAYIVTLGR